MPDLATASAPRRLSLLLLLALLAGLLAGSLPPAGAPRAFAGDPPPLSEEEEERLEAIERHTERGWRAFRAGNHEEVLARMKRLRKYAPEDPLPDYLTARVEVRTGKYDEALERVTKAVATHPGHKGLEAVRFDLLLRLGRIDALLAAARAALAANPKDGMAQCAVGLAHEERGRREEALTAYEASIDTYDRTGSPPEDIPWIARAAIHATWLSPNPADDLLAQANKLMTRYQEAHPDDQDVLLMVGDLFRSNRGPRGQSLARKYYRKLLQENSEVASARVGLAHTFLVFYQQDRAIAELERALATNPNHVPALALYAAIHVGNGDYEKSEKLIERALAVRPEDKETRAVKAALLWITGKRAEYEALEKEVLAYDPTYGRFYVIISDLVGERQRRYDVAAEFARKAVATDGNDELGYVVLGEALMNLGRTDEARKQFEIAVDKGKRYKDVKRDNWLEVLRVIDDFDTVESKHFVIRMHPSEMAVMRPYLPPLLEASWYDLSKKYGYTPASPVRVDSFHMHVDFSVRSVGVTGLPALGVCFGGVITLLGPTTDTHPVGSFSWARTAWHEFAHVITLGQSKGQVPRWLTEGLSVYEEKQRRSIWGRDNEQQLYNRWRNGNLLKMDKINSAFRGPDIGFAYYQGGLIAEQLTKEHGFEVIPRMLVEFARDRTTAQVFKDVLGLDLKDYDEQFDAYVESLVGDYKITPRWNDESMDRFRERVKKDPEDAEAWVRLGWSHLQRGRSIDAGTALARAAALAPEDPEVVLLTGRLAQANERKDLATAAYERFLALGADDLETRLFLAQQEIERGRDTAKAIEHLEAAKRCFPYLVGKHSPYVLLAKLYKGGGKTEKAIAELEAYSKVAGEDYGVREELKAWYRGKKDHEAVVRTCEEMVDINPFGAVRGKEPDLDLHKDYAEALLALGREDEAIRELEVQVSLLGTVDEEPRRQAGGVKTHVTLGDLYLSKDRPVDALEQAIAALRLSPDDTDARMLKIRAEEAAGYR